MELAAQLESLKKRREKTYKTFIAPIDLKILKLEEAIKQLNNQTVLNFNETNLNRILGHE